MLADPAAPSASGLMRVRGTSEGKPSAERREDKEDVGRVFCPGSAAKSRSIFELSSLP